MNEREKNNFLDVRPQVTGKIGSRGEFGGEEYLYFAGNNYLDLARRPELIEGAVEAAKKYGTTFGAGRTTTGTADIHLKLEKKLAEFKGTEAAIIFPSGYLGNQIILSGLVREGDALICDELAHPSILEALPRSKYEVVTFRHNDVDDLRNKIESKSRGLILVNGVDPSVGELAPLDKIEEVSRNGGFRILVDDAHATGVLGKNGRGTPEHFGVSSDRIFQTETMSKALGSYGGFIAGSEEFIENLRDVSQTYRGSTPLPPAVVGASITAVKIATEEPELRDRVKSNAKHLSNKLISLNLDANWYGSAILKLDISEKLSKKIYNHLLKKKIMVPYIHYPRLKSPGRLRLTVSAGHSERDIDTLVETIAECLGEDQ